MHTFRLREGKYEVGHYAEGDFKLLFSVGELWDAVKAVSMLNGGTDKDFGIDVEVEDE